MLVKKVVININTFYEVKTINIRLILLHILNTFLFFGFVCVEDIFHLWKIIFFKKGGKFYTLQNSFFKREGKNI